MSAAKHTPGRVLTAFQAHAVYGALRSLNVLGMDQFRTAFPGGGDGRGTSHIYVEASKLANRWPVKVSIYSSLNVEDNYTETYTDQNAFAAAYNMEPPLFSKAAGSAS